jgi:photosystem II stability/assembly factor-like uncharacterized protein
MFFSRLRRSLKINTPIPLNTTDGKISVSAQAWHRVVILQRESVIYRGTSLPLEESELRLTARRPGLALLFFLGALGLNISTVGQSISPDLFSGLQWRLIGPFRGGRVVAVAGVPGDGTIFYFGSVGGGIWKTIDAGVTWTPIFDGQPIASIGALEVAPSNPNILYAGTGESDIRSDLSSGDGVYKSTDGGATWKPIGLRDSRQISRIVIDPANADVVYVGVLGHAYGPNDERGVYKSTDGGQTWTRVLDKGPEIGVSDLAIAAGSPNILFAGMWNAHRPPWSTYAPLAGPGSGLYRSTDSGATWTQLTAHGLPDGNWGRVGVAVAPDGKRVYAVIEAAKKSGLYRSDDGGDNWTLVNSDPRLTSRAWYFNRITVDPIQADVIYIPNVALYRSEDGGKTISLLRGAPGGDDYHQLWVDPKNSSRMILGTDQGTTVSLNYGKTWSSWYNQPTAQFYHVITDNEFPYHVYGAQQDTGAAAIASRTNHGLITPRDWFMVGGSESGWLALDPTDPNILYATSQYGGVVRWDRRTSFSQDISPWSIRDWNTEINEHKYRGPWTPPLIFSPIEKNTLYLGTQYVMKTTDGGLHWQQISPDLTGAAPNAAGQKPSGPTTVQNAKERGFGVVFSIAASPLKAGQIWAGSDTSLIHLTLDGGKTWQNVTPPSLANWSRVSMIEASRFDPAVAYAAVDRHRMDDYRPYIYRTRDYGKTWQPITTGIAATSVNAIRQDTQKKDLLFAGTELGIYVSFDAGDHWQPLQLNLPATSVRDITIHGDDLIIATHGRSFWILDNITSLRQMSAQAQKANAWLFQPANAIRIDNDGFLGSPLPPEEPTARNPPDGAIIDYYLQIPEKGVKLEIFDSSNKLVRRFTNGQKPEEKRPPQAIAERWLAKPVILESSAGMHRFIWDLRWSSSGTDENEDEDGAGAPRGPRSAPGIYTATLTVDGKTLTQNFKVEMDPRSPATKAELDEQQRLALEIFGEARRARKTLAEISAAKNRLDDVKAQLATKNPELLSQVVAAEAAITKIEKGSQTPITTTGLESASAGLAAALRVVESGDRTVPSQAMELYRESDEAAKAETAEWTRLKSTQLVQLNDALQKAGFRP